MPIEVTYPGVYVQEVPSGMHVIPGVTTAVPGFVDVFERGPEHTPTQVTSFREFTRVFGALRQDSRASVGIYQFFLNGGSTAWVVRVPGADAAAASATVDGLELVASGSGTWGNRLQAAMKLNSAGIALAIREVMPADGDAPAHVIAAETYRGLDLDPASDMFWRTVLQNQSALVRASAGTSTTKVAITSAAPKPPGDAVTRTAIHDPSDQRFVPFTGGVDDFTIGAADLGQPAAGDLAATGMYTLSDISPNRFDLLCLPVMAGFTADEWNTAFAEAVHLCEGHRAFFIVDHPANLLFGVDPDERINRLEQWFDANVSNRTGHAAMYVPRLIVSAPAQGPGSFETETSGTVAGVYARTDASDGVWKAPAGQRAVLAGVGDLAIDFTDEDNASLNSLGINAIRQFPVLGNVVWGARTVRGADLLDSDWKYVNVRRLVLFIEESIDEGTQWAVFEPNDEPLWSALRLQVGGFLNGLYKMGAFAATSAKDAYFVACDQTTTTPLDQERGIVNMQIGFAPLRPAEFIVIHLAQQTAPA